MLFAKLNKPVILVAYIFSLIICFVFCSVFCESQKPVSQTPEIVLNRIESSLQLAGLKRSSLGLVISQILPNNQIAPIYSLNAEQLFIPASLVKIASLSALYYYYPHFYTFKTEFISSATEDHGVLRGDLVLKGGGDPGFTSEGLWNLVNHFTRSGITHIQGDILVDDSLYAKEQLTPVSEESYMAPISASSFNWNVVAFYIRPAKTLKASGRVLIDPENTYIQFKNKVITGRKDKVHIKRKHLYDTGEMFKVSGSINRQTKEITKYKNITRPALWLGSNAVSFLAQRGIKVAGSVKKGQCKGNCHTLAEWESRPLAFHSYNVMKYSSNFVVQMLVSHLPLLQGEKKGSLKRGMRWIHTYLTQKQGITRFHLVDPSGLNRKNRFSPKDLQKLLVQQTVGFYNPEMLFSYPLAGGKGTLEKRFKASSFIRAKTGSLHGVLGLAGWFKNLKQNKDYVFVFIFNGKDRKTSTAQTLFDEIILSLMT